MSTLMTLIDLEPQKWGF